MKPEFPRVVYDRNNERWKAAAPSWYETRKPAQHPPPPPPPSPAEAASVALATQVRVNVATAWTSLEAAARKAGTGELREAARQATLAGAFLLNALAAAWIAALLKGE